MHLVADSLFHGGQSRLSFSAVTHRTYNVGWSYESEPERCFGERLYLLFQAEVLAMLTRGTATAKDFGPCVFGHRPSKPPVEAPSPRLGRRIGQVRRPGDLWSSHPADALRAVSRCLPLDVFIETPSPASVSFNIRPSSSLFRDVGFAYSGENAVVHHALC